MALFHRPLPRTLAASLRDLKEKNPTVRRSAILDLARHSREEATPEIIDALLEAMSDVDPTVRTEAAYCLGDATAERALPTLLLAVDDPHTAVRQAAIDALGTIGDSRATGRLLRAIEDERADVRFQAVIALGRVSPRDGMNAAIGAMEDEDCRVRYIAIRTVEEIVVGDDNPHGDLGAESATVSLITNKKLPDVVAKKSQSWLEDEDPHVRLAAAILLGKFGDLRGADQLLDAVAGRIGSIEPEDEVAAIELCGLLQLEQAIPDLDSRAFGLMRFIRERHTWTARVALVHLGSVRARHALLDDLHSWSRERRTAAVMACAQAGLTDALDAIKSMRGDHEKAVQEAVEEAIAQLSRVKAPSEKPTDEKVIADQPFGNPPSTD
ncbi:MAG: HEAT repeat domain-containing protein [Polyangiaceae bacterium]|nr:HEAT repeat domain-containing protein [Polyangiaceae bacterium]